MGNNSGFRQIISGKDIGGTSFALPVPGENTHSSPDRRSKKSDKLKMLQNQAINSKGFSMQTGNYKMSPQPGVSSDMYNINTQMGSPNSHPQSLEKDRSRNGNYESTHRTKDRIRRHERRKNQDE